MLRRVEIDLLRLYSQVLTTTTIGFSCVTSSSNYAFWQAAQECFINRECGLALQIYIYIIFFLILHFLHADVVKGMKTKVVFSFIKVKYAMSRCFHSGFWNFKSSRIFLTIHKSAATVTLRKQSNYVELTSANKKTSECTSDCQPTSPWGKTRTRANHSPCPGGLHCFVQGES